MTTSKRLINIISIQIFMIITAVIFIIPFYWMAISSLKPTGEIFTTGFALLPENPTLESYRKLLFERQFVRWFINSIAFAVGYVLGGVLICAGAGYSFAKFDFPFKNFLFILILGAYMLPIHMLVIPLFIMLTGFNMVNSYTGLILPMIANPLGVFFIRQYMVGGVPNELLDAGRVDGATEVSIFFRLVLPLAKPALAAIAIVFSLFAWNNLIWPLVIMRSTDMFTLTVGLSTLVGVYRPQYGVLMAGSFIAVIPVIILFIRMQEHFIAGLTAGSIKG